MKRQWRAGLAVMIGLVAGQALGSGGPAPTPIYVERRGGTAAELALLYAGRPGMVMMGAKEPMLFLDWRLLRRLPVGAEAGAALARSAATGPGDNAPCLASTPGSTRAPSSPPAPAAPSWVASDRQGPDYTSIPNCFPDAFEKAPPPCAIASPITTPRRAPSSPAATQDAVFNACANANSYFWRSPADAPRLARRRSRLSGRPPSRSTICAMPRPPRASPRSRATAPRPGSHWASISRPRDVARSARPPTPTISPAPAAIATLASAPAGTFGKGEVTGMTRALAYRDQPAAL